MPHVKISAASSGANTLVAAVIGRSIRVLGFVIVAAGAVTANFESGTTDLSGAMSLITGVPISAPLTGSLDILPWMQTASGEALGLTLGGAVQVSGFLVYDVV